MYRGATMSVEFDSKETSYAVGVAYSDDSDSDDADSSDVTTRSDTTTGSDGGEQERETLSAAAVRLGRVITEIRCTQDGICPICQSGLKGRSVAHLPCGHALHGSFDEHFYYSACQTREKCPVCRKSFLPGMRREVRDRLIAARPALAMELLLAEAGEEEGEEAVDM